MERGSFCVSHAEIEILVYNNLSLKYVFEYYHEKVFQMF